MVKQSRKAIEKAVGSKKEAEPINSQTISSRKRASAKVTSISADGFWLRVGGVDYFLAFTNFPWFRYASDNDIKSIEVWRNCDPENDGDFTVYWQMLDVHLPTKGIEWHMKNPVKPPHPITYPITDGKFVNRLKDTSVSEMQYEVEMSFTFKGKFTVTAKNADQARQHVEKHCSANLGGIVIDVHVPINEIAWDFPYWRDGVQKNIENIKEL